MNKQDEMLPPTIGVIFTMRSMLLIVFLSFLLISIYALYELNFGSRFNGVVLEGANSSSYVSPECGGKIDEMRLRIEECESKAELWKMWGAY